MTTYNPRTQSPLGIETLEQAILHLGLVAEALYAGQTYRESESTAIAAGLSPLIDLSISRTADGSIRAIIRLSIELDPAYATGSDPLWLYARPLGQAQIPASFRAAE